MADLGVGNLCRSYQYVTSVPRKQSSRRTDTTTSRPHALLGLVSAAIPSGRVHREHLGGPRHQRPILNKPGSDGGVCAHSRLHRLDSRFGRLLSSATTMVRVFPHARSCQLCVGSRRLRVSSCSLGTASRPLIARKISMHYLALGGTSYLTKNADVSPESLQTAAQSTRLTIGGVTGETRMRTI